MKLKLVVLLLVAQIIPSALPQTILARHCPVLGTWESSSLGYAKFVFDRKGNYDEIQEGLDRKTGTRAYRTEARGQYLLNVRELTLHQNSRTLTNYKPDGSVDRSRKYGRAGRLVFLLFPKSHRMQVTDTDGSKRVFERVSSAY